MNGVATHLPSRSTRSRTVAGAASWNVTVSASPLPSPFGVNDGRSEGADPSVRVTAIWSWLRDGHPVDRPR